MGLSGPWPPGSDRVALPLQHDPLTPVSASIELMLVDYELSEGKWKERDGRCVFLYKILIQTLIDIHILMGECSTLIPGRPISFYFVFFSNLFTSVDRGQVVYNGFS